jgi:molecular chaperone GrpE
MKQKEKDVKDKKEKKTGTSPENAKVKDQQKEVPEMKEDLKDQQNDKTGKSEKTEETKPETKKKDKKEKKKKKEPNFEEMYNDLNDKYLRLTAEFDNYRKRTLKERMELMKNAGEDILVNFLPIMDNIDRAVLSLNDAKDLEAVKEGIKLIHKNLFDFLNERGVKEMESIGKEFDTDLHEAITKIPAPEEELKGKVVDVIEKGYTMKDKVLRYAKVVVGE